MARKFTRCPRMLGSVASVATSSLLEFQELFAAFTSPPASLATFLLRPAFPVPRSWVTGSLGKPCSCRFWSSAYEIPKREGSTGRWVGKSRLPSTPSYPLGSPRCLRYPSLLELLPLRIPHLVVGTRSKAICEAGYS